MGRGSFVEVKDRRVFVVEGSDRLYSVRKKQEEIYQDDFWSLHVVFSDGRYRPNGERWASCRLYRLFNGSAVFHVGVHLGTGRVSKTSCQMKLDESYPGVLEWMLDAVMARSKSGSAEIPPAPPPPDVKPPPKMVATKLDERVIVDFIRERWREDRPLSRRRVTRKENRYVGDEAEYYFAIAEPVVFDVVRRMVEMQIVEDVMLDRRSRKRGLRVNEFAYGEYFEKEKIDV